MTIIEVMVIMTDDEGKKYTYWGGETGTNEFYMVKYTLEAYLGDKLLIYHHPNNDTFIIEDEDEGCDNSYDYVKIIESIYDNTQSYECHDYLSFDILNME